MLNGRPLFPEHAVMNNNPNNNCYDGSLMEGNNNENNCNNNNNSNDNSNNNSNNKNNSNNIGYEYTPDDILRRHLLSACPDDVSQFHSTLNFDGRNSVFLPSFVAPLRVNDGFKWLRDKRKWGKEKQKQQQQQQQDEQRQTAIVKTAVKGDWSGLGCRLGGMKLFQIR